MIELRHGDCLEQMRYLADNSVDMVLCDLPYGTTKQNWDSVIDLSAMWAHLARIVKPNGAMIFTAAQPFTTTLIASNTKQFKYCWYWKKPPIGFLNSKKRPLVNIEEVVVFVGKGYKPQGLIAVTGVKKRAVQTASVTHDGGKLASEQNKSFTNYPTQLLEFGREYGLHPTQKPVALCEYLIKTYSNKGDTVLDFTMGSGTTGVAAINTGRKFIGIELKDFYFQIAKNRINSVCAV